MFITSKLYGKINTTNVEEYTITNSKGVAISAIPFGATLTKLIAPDRKGKLADITLNVDNLDDFITYRPFYGATIGRVAGRITKGQYSLDGKDYQLDTNEGNNLLHGGPEGFDTKLWHVETEIADKQGRLIFTYTSPEGENNFPGNLWVQVTYTLTEESEWIIEYKAKTDEPTLFNPTNHVYFNLSGDKKQSILNHELYLKSDFYAPLGEENLPKGELKNVEGTPFDFTAPKLVKDAVYSDHPQIKPLNGLDHPFVLSPKEGDSQGVLYEPESGREVTLYTDRNSVVVFTHNGEVDDYSIQGEPARQYAGITLETQTLPDAVNQTGFGHIILRPKETFTSKTTYKIGVRND